MADTDGSIMLCSKYYIRFTSHSSRCDALNFISSNAGDLLTSDFNSVCGYNRINVVVYRACAAVKLHVTG